MEGSTPDWAEAEATRPSKRGIAYFRAGPAEVAAVAVPVGVATRSRPASHEPHHRNLRGRGRRPLVVAAVITVGTVGGPSSAQHAGQGPLPRAELPHRAAAHHPDPDPDERRNGWRLRELGLRPQLGESSSSDPRHPSADPRPQQISRPATEKSCTAARPRPPR